MDNDNRRGKEVGEPSLADANARLKEKVMALEREKKQLAATLEERERDLKEAKIMAEERKELIAEIRSAAARTGLNSPSLESSAAPLKARGVTNSRVVEALDEALEDDDGVKNYAQVTRNFSVTLHAEPGEILDSILGSNEWGPNELRQVIVEQTSRSGEETRVGVRSEATKNPTGARSKATKRCEYAGHSPSS